MIKKITLTILIIILAGFGLYYFTQKADRVEINQETVNTNDKEENHRRRSPNPSLERTKEESPDEIFRDQPGEVKSIQSTGNKGWMLKVDILTQNSNWISGENEFFINQNPKISELTVASDTKTFSCGEGPDADSTTHDVQVDTEEYIKKLEEGSYKNRYFDITGTVITSIYDQCLP